MEPYEKLELTSKDITLPPIPTEQPPIMTQENALFNNIKLNLGAINDFLANDISATNISALVPVEYKNIQQYLRNLVRDQYQAGWKFDIPQFNSLNSL